VNETEILEVLEKKGAILRGHFRLSSGRHSDVFVQKFRILEHPRLAQSFGEEIAKHFAGSFDAVASPAVGAIVLGFMTALAANVRMLFAERVEGGELQFRRGFQLAPHEKTLIVEDVITTGGSAREVADLVRASGAIPVGIGALIDRGDPARTDLGVPLHALLRLDVASWTQDECPLCASGQEFDDPGSRRL
jgi:orotate phosphoribosyltransferase